MFLNLLPKTYLYGVLALAILAGGVLAHHKGVVAGEAEVQAQFDAYKLQQAGVVAKTLADNAAQEAAAKKANDEQIAQYRAQLASSSTYGRDLARRLRLATSHNGSGPVSEGSGQPGATGSGPQGGSDAITVAVGDTFSECRNNADQLDSLINEVKRQL